MAISKNAIIAIGAGSALALLGGAVAVGKIRKNSRTKKRKTNNNKASRKRNNTRKRRTPHTAGKRKDRSHKRIRYTKNGQPYIILKSGKARFISIKSAKAGHKRKGGRY